MTSATSRYFACLTGLAGLARLAAQFCLNKGIYLFGRIAAIAVPQRAKGSTMASQRRFTGFNRPQAPF